MEKKSFKNFSIPQDFEITVNSRLSPEKIGIYLKNINVQFESEILEMVFHYLIFIRGKYLQMMVANHIGKSDSESVTSEFQRFNRNHQKLLSVFYKVSGYELVTGRVPDPKVAKIKPEILILLEKLDLIHLSDIFVYQRTTFEDLLTMTNENLREIGITNWNQRKRIIDSLHMDVGKFQTCVP